MDKENIRALTILQFNDITPDVMEELLKMEREGSEVATKTITLRSSHKEPKEIAKEIIDLKKKIIDFLNDKG